MGRNIGFPLFWEKMNESSGNKRDFHKEKNRETMRKHRLLGLKENFFLGHVVSCDCIRVDPKKIEVITNCPSSSGH